MCMCILMDLSNIFYHEVIVTVGQSKLKMQDCEVEDIEIGTVFCSSSIFIAVIDHFQKYAEISSPSPNHLISHLYTRAITYVICNDKVIFKLFLTPSTHTNGYILINL